MQLFCISSGLGNPLQDFYREHLSLNVYIPFSLVEDGSWLVEYEYETEQLTAKFEILTFRSLYYFQDY